MIWALLFSIIFGGSDSVFLNPKIEKHIKKHVEQKDTRKEIQVIIKEYESIAKKVNKEEKKWNKQLSELNVDRSTTVAEFKAFFQLYMNSKQELNSNGLSTRFKIRDKITYEDWGKIIAEAKITHVKEEKNRVKYISNLRKSISKSEKKVVKNISEIYRREEAGQAILDFKDLVIEIQKDYDRYNYAENDVLANYNSSMNDLRKVQEDVDFLKWKLFNGYIDTHMILVKVTTDEEWNAVIKSFNKIL